MQKAGIAGMLRENTDREIQTALDYGGNEGKTFFRSLGTKQKIVFDISGIKTVKGVIGISDYEELKKYKTHAEIIEALSTLDYVYHIEEMR